METLKEAREKKGIKQLAVAEALGVSRQTYAKWEDAPHIMPIFQAQAACAYIGVDFDSIIFSENVS